MKIIRFFKNIKELNEASVIGTFGIMFLSFYGICLALIGFLMGLEQRGFHGITVWFDFPALIFYFSIFCLTFISYLRND